MTSFTQALLEFSLNFKNFRFNKSNSNHNQNNVVSTNTATTTTATIITTVGTNNNQIGATMTRTSNLSKSMISSVNNDQTDKRQSTTKETDKSQTKSNGVSSKLFTVHEKNTHRKKLSAPAPPKHKPFIHSSSNNTQPSNVHTKEVVKDKFMYQANPESTLNTQYQIEYKPLFVDKIATDKQLPNGIIPNQTYEMERNQFIPTRSVNSTPTSPVFTHNYLLNRDPVITDTLAATTTATTTNPNGDISSVSRLTFLTSLSPTMTHRLAILARNCQTNNCGNNVNMNDNYTVYSNQHTYSPSQSLCSSPAMPHRGATVAAIKQRLISQGLKINLNLSTTKKTISSRYRDYVRRMNRKLPVTINKLWFDSTLMKQIFSKLVSSDLKQSCLVCKQWYKIMISAKFYHKLIFTINVKQILNECYQKYTQELTHLNETNPDEDCLNYEKNVEQYLYNSVQTRMMVLVKRRIETLKLIYIVEKYADLIINAINNVIDQDETMNSDNYQQMSNMKINNNTTFTAYNNNSGPVVEERCNIADHFGQMHSVHSLNHTTDKGLSDVNPLVKSSSQPLKQTDPNGSDNILYIKHLIIKYSIIYDENLSRLINLFQNLQHLEIDGCNDFSELALWSCLQPSLEILTIFDCIHISDVSVSAISQLLPELKQLNLQAYHITDASMCYFSIKQRANLHTICLTQCMDLTNQGIINLAKCLTNLHTLNVSGCTKLTDDGLDVICDNLKLLTSLDLSWCSKITDSGMECVACDLVKLQKLVLDRCIGLTDLGISHLATMPRIQHLSLRWCFNLSDICIPHLLSTTGLVHLYLTGCKRISEDGLCTLARHPRLNYLELYHLPSATYSIKAYLAKHLPDCQILG